MRFYKKKNYAMTQIQMGRLRRPDNTSYVHPRMQACVSRRVAAVAVASVCVAGALMLGPQLLRALSSGGAFLSHVSMFVAASAADLPRTR